MALDANGRELVLIQADDIGGQRKLRRALGRLRVAPPEFA